MVLYNAMRKYGVDVFTIEDVEVLEADTKEELSRILNERETHFIATLNPPYNTAPGGLGHTGIPWTEERRQKFKELMSGENNPNYGKQLSDDTKEKLSASLKGRIISEESRKKTSETMKGVPKSEETRRKMAEAQKGHKMAKGKDSKKAIAIHQFDKDGNFKSGGIFSSSRPKSAIARDRKYTSQQEWEQDYVRKASPRLTYREGKYEGGGEMHRNDN
jgi:group I intron endonuclease